MVRTSKWWPNLLLEVSKGGMIETFNAICTERNSGQFSAIILKVDKEIGIWHKSKVLNFGHDITRRLTSSSAFSIFQPVRSNVRISWKSNNNIRDFEILAWLWRSEVIINFSRDCDHLEAIIVMEGVKRSSSWSLPIRGIIGETLIDFNHGESMNPRRCSMRKKEPVTHKVSRASKYLGPSLRFELS